MVIEGRDHLSVSPEDLEGFHKLCKLTVLL